MGTIFGAIRASKVGSFEDQKKFETGLKKVIYDRKLNINYLRDVFEPSRDFSSELDENRFEIMAVITFL